MAEVGSKLEIGLVSEINSEKHLTEANPSVDTTVGENFRGGYRGNFRNNNSFDRSRGRSGDRHFSGNLTRN